MYLAMIGPGKMSAKQMSEAQPKWKRYILNRDIGQGAGIPEKINVAYESRDNIEYGKSSHSQNVYHFANSQISADNYF